jgi:hypothetical protein
LISFFDAYCRACLSSYLPFQAPVAVVATALNISSRQHPVCGRMSPSTFLRHRGFDDGLG